MSMQIAIDVGSGFTQYTDGELEGTIPSLVAQCPERLDFGAESAQILECNGKKYLLGHDAEAFASNEADIFNTLTDKWAGSEAWMQLVYMALAQANANNQDVDLITGLPQEYYLDQRETVLQCLEGQHNFKVSGVEHNVNINPIVIPQASGAIFYAASYDPSIFEYDIGVIDVGTYTTGLSVIQEGKRFVPRKSGSYPVGMSNLIHVIHNYLNKQRNLLIEKGRIPKILLSKKFMYQGEKMDISEEINKKTFYVAEELLRGIEEKWPNHGRELIVYVAGGGAPYFIDAINSIIPHANVMNNSFYAVVRGMFAYLYGQKAQVSA